MIYFTELRRLPVLDPAGRRLGRVVDLVLLPDGDRRRVSKLVVRAGTRRLEVPADAVIDVSGGGIRISREAGQLAEFSPQADDLLAARHLLDRQVIDIRSRQVVRVNDLGFLEEQANGRCELRLAEVDAGTRSAFRRLFEGLLSSRTVRRVNDRLAQHALAWETVELIEASAERRRNWSINHQKLAGLHPTDLADIVEELAPAEREAIFQTLDDTISAHALAELKRNVQRCVIEALPRPRAARLLEAMAPDQAADLLAHLPHKAAEAILEAMRRTDAAEIEELLEFPRNTAGGMMTTRYIRVPAAESVQGAIQALFAGREAAAASCSIFLVDGDERLAGAIPIARLLLYPPGTPLARLRMDPPLSVAARASDDEVVEMFERHRLLSLPVVDERRRLIGVIRADDVIALLKSRL